MYILTFCIPPAIIPQEDTMEYLHTQNTDNYRLTEQAEIEAVRGALIAFEAAGTTHITDEDKERARQLREQLPHQAPTDILTSDDITFLAGASKYFLGAAHHIAEKQRHAATAEALAAAQAIADINKPLSAK